MSKVKRYVLQQMEKVKSSASQLISSPESDEPVVELEPFLYEKLKLLADAQQTTVQEVTNRILEQHLAFAESGSARDLGTDRKENNPLLYLDAICQKIN
jgi:hypothetical protein